MATVFASVSALCSVPSRFIMYSRDEGPSFPSCIADVRKYFPSRDQSVTMWFAGSFTAVFSFDFTFTMKLVTSGGPSSGDRSTKSLHTISVPSGDQAKSWHETPRSVPGSFSSKARTWSRRTGGSPGLETSWIKIANCFPSGDSFASPG